MRALPVFLGLLLILAASCSKKTPAPQPNPVKETDRFLGSYSTTTTHITGIHVIYDSGVVVGMEEHTQTVVDSLLRITESAHSDTLMVEGLLKSWLNHREIAKAVLVQDSLEIIYDKSNLTHNNYIRGKIWVSGDSIFLDYLWLVADTWSPGALPTYGKVKTRGFILD